MDDITYCLCGKLNFKICGKSIIRYVVRENREMLMVHLENDPVVYVMRPTFDRVRRVFRYASINADQIVVTQYWPIRPKMITGGKVCMTFNRFAISKDNMIL